jgi:hypothetical protein
MERDGPDWAFATGAALVIIAQAIITRKMLVLIMKQGFMSPLSWFFILE